MEYTSIYGYIKIDRDYKKSVHHIQSLGVDTNFPFITTNMFSFGESERPYYYENIIISFAATYKYFGDRTDWNDFILKMEDILRNVDFENAQFHVESSIGDFTLSDSADLQSVLTLNQKRADYTRGFSPNGCSKSAPSKRITNPHQQRY